MKSSKTFILSVLLTLGCNVVFLHAGAHFDKDLNQPYKKISDIPAECRKIAPGMTRAELADSFMVYSGGFMPSPAFQQHQTFFYRRYDLIKIDVEFVPSDSKMAQPTDTISWISEPYPAKSALD